MTGAVVADEARLDEADSRLRTELAGLGRAVVAFSGGADSTFLAAMASEVLGPANALCITAVSPSLAPEELEDCRSLAVQLGLRHLEVTTGELDDVAYARNDGDRCYHCKAHLLDAVAPLAEAEGAVVVLGVNVDDLSDHRPGQRAASERGALFPMVQAGLSKDDVRALSRRMGLPTWDKPAAACLASRVPYGTPVTLGVLSSVARAETALRHLGFRSLRVRHHGDTARIELEPSDLGRAVEMREELVDAVTAAGYRYVTLDLAGLRSGNLNAALGHRGGTK